MTNQNSSPWTDDLRSEVKEMWRTQSAQQIATALQQRGYPFSRNAIVGLVHRAGLTIEQKTEAKSRRSPTTPRERRVPPVLRLVGASKCAVWIEPASVDIIPRNLVLDDLGKNECRYPYGGGPFLFCGHSTDGGSYCAGHKVLCYIAPQRRMAA